jgi:hypothetical protein
MYTLGVEKMKRTGKNQLHGSIQGKGRSCGNLWREDAGQAEPLV